MLRAGCWEEGREHGRDLSNRGQRCCCCGDGFHFLTPSVDLAPSHLTLLSMRWKMIALLFLLCSVAMLNTLRAASLC